MLHRVTHHCVLRLSLGLACAIAVAAIVPGCNSTPKRKPIELKPLYTTLPPKDVPALFKDTLMHRCDVQNTDPFLVSGYGVVVNLDNTGSSEAPNLVRQYIYDMMVKRKWGSSLTGVKLPPPEQALRDPRVAIVQVDGYLPAGVRKGQGFDLQVSALPEGNTTSLAGGELWETDLRIMGANPSDPAGAVNVFGRGSGPVFCNPAYALDPRASEDAAARRSLRYGVVMNGARSLEDRPIALRLRTPSLRMSRYIEDLIDERFQEIKPDTLAAAQDEGIVNVFVPHGYFGDWEHFIGVVTHLYLDNTPEFSAAKARQLADEAVKPDAPLMDISYCWEALGPKAALPVIVERNLMASTDPDVAYAAARAAAFLGDQTAPQALVKIATTTGHKFQINAIQVLGALPSSPAINEMLRPLLNSNETLVRLEAYKMLANNKDSSIFSTPVGAGFILDVVRSDGAPMIFATRRAQPRIAIIGSRVNLAMPVTFTAMDGRLSISSDTANKNVTVFYRPSPPPGGVRSASAEAQLAPIRVLSNPDLAEIIARLGGEGVEIGRALPFNYGQIVSILSNMTSAQQIVASSTTVASGKLPASFFLQELPEAQHDSIYNAPAIQDQGRPQTDEPGRVGMAK